MNVEENIAEAEKIISEMKENMQENLDDENSGRSRHNKFPSFTLSHGIEKMSELETILASVLAGRNNSLAWFERELKEANRRAKTWECLFLFACLVILILFGL